MDDRDAQKAFNYACRLLGYRPRSEAELKERLRLKGHPPKAAGLAIGRLKELGYIDDKATAMSLVRRAQEVKGLGRSGARMFLKKMGIAKDDAEEALEDYEEDATARELVEHRLKRLEGKPRAEVRRKLAGYLGRRGYSASTIAWVLRELLNE